jgi:signal transduction histidine kinase
MVELSVTDDGKGFGGVDPLGPTEAGHIGLASIRERAELLRGSLDIRTGDDGTEVRVSAPMPRRPLFGLRRGG